MYSASVRDTVPSLLKSASAYVIGTLNRAQRNGPNFTAKYPSAIRLYRANKNTMNDGYRERSFRHPQPSSLNPQLLHPERRCIGIKRMP